MSKYKTKPCAIEAVQWTGENADEIYNFCSKNVIIRWRVFQIDLEIVTLEGIMKAEVGDYIVKGLKGEFYPCKPDVFKQKYEKVECEK